MLSLSSKREEPLKIECAFNFIDRDLFKTRLRQNLESCLSNAKEDPCSILHDFIGLMYYENNDFSQAEQFFKKSIELDPHNYWAYSNFAHMLQKLERAQEAKKLIQKVALISEDRKKFIKLFSLGFYYLRMHANSSAILQFDEALKKPFQILKLKIYKATALIRSQKEKAAIQLLEECLKEGDLGAFEIQVLRKLGQAYLKLSKNSKSKIKKSVEYLEAGLKINPKDFDLLELRAEAWGIDGNVPQAIACYDTIIQHHPSTFAYQHRAALYRRVKDFKQAERDLEKSIEIRPENYTAAMDLVILRYESLRKYEQVINDCQRLSFQHIGIYNLVRVLYYLGQALLIKEELEASEEAFFKMFFFYDKREASGKGLGKLEACVISAKMALSAVYRKKYVSLLQDFKYIKLEIYTKNHAAAMESLNKVLSLAPEASKDALYFKAVILNREEKYKEALEILFSINSMKDLNFTYIEKEDFQRELSHSIKNRISEVNSGADVFLEAFKTFLILKDYPGFTETLITLCRMLALLVEKVDTFPPVALVKVVSALLKGLNSKNTLYQVEKNLLYKTLHIREVDAAVSSSPAMDVTRDAWLLFSSENLKLLYQLRNSELEITSYQLFRQADTTQPVPSVQMDWIEQAITQGRKILDYHFIAFCKKKYSQEIDFAPFPCVPRNDHSGLTALRLKNFIEHKKMGKQRAIGFKNFSDDQPALFQYLLSIQPLENPEYLWLEQLYEIRNKMTHERGLGSAIEYELNGKTLNLIDFSLKIIRGVYSILWDFYGCTDEGNNLNSLRKPSDELSQLLKECESSLERSLEEEKMIPIKKENLTQSSLTFTPLRNTVLQASHQSDLKFLEKGASQKVRFG